MRHVIFAAAVFLSSATANGAPIKGTVEFQAKAVPGFLNINATGGKLVGDVTVLDGKATGTFSMPWADVKTGIETRDDHMKNKYLDVKTNPDVKFVLKPWTISEKESDFEGDLTVKGVTKPVKGKAALKAGHFHAVMPVKISDYPIGKVEFNGVGLKDEVTVTVDGAQ
jgi:polyisoprenoid-binding protein YceI